MKDTEPAKESDVMEQTKITNDISKAEDPLDHEASEDEREENTYSGRVIGVHKKTQENLKKKPITSKEQCPNVEKGCLNFFQKVCKSLVGPRPGPHG